MVIDRVTWQPQLIFGFMQQLGQLADHEMLRTFNMGVGLVVVAPPGLTEELASLIGQGNSLRVWELGRVEPDHGVRFTGQAAKTRAAL